MRVGPAATLERVTRIVAALPLLIYGIGGNYEEPSPFRIAALVAGALALAGALRDLPWSGWVALAASLGLGVHERVTAGQPGTTDVILATREALTVLAQGIDPYAHWYLSTNPPGSPFAYLPGELAFYGLWQLGGGDVLRADRYAGIGVLMLLTALAPLIGEGVTALAVGTCAFAGDLVFHATDGSNDTAASFVVLSCIVAVAWATTLRGRPATIVWWIAAIAGGWALAFKAYSLPIVLFVALYLARTVPARAKRWIAVVVGVALAFTLPLFLWNPIGFVANVGGALFVHANIWGRNVWRDLAGNAPAVTAAIAPFVPVVTLGAAVAVGVAAWRRPASNLGIAVLQGVAVVATLLLFARWTTSVYYVFLAPVAVAGVALALGGPAMEALHQADVSAVRYTSD